jgi:hypothetical protein
MTRAVLCSLACAALLASCGFEPIPVPDSGTMKPGPGLLTGESGEFVIHGRR